MAVRQRDRDFMRRIGALKGATHEEAVAQHRTLPLDERMHRSWALYLAWRDRSPVAERHDDPSPFYERARSRGLYRP